MITSLKHFGVFEETIGPVAHPDPTVVVSSQPSLKARLATGYYCFSFGFFTWIWATILTLCFFFPLLLLPAIAYACYAYGPGAHPSYDGSWPTPLQRWKMWHAMKTYFPQCALHKTTDLPPNKSYIFGQHPHGILAFGTWLAFGCDALGFQTKFPGIDVRVSTLNINFRAPFLREYLLLHGVCSVSKEAVINILNAGKSVCIAIGGSAESLLTQPGRYDLVLNRRKGFVRCALQTGASLVPVISFGEPEMYTTVNQVRHNHPIRRFQRKIEKTLGFTLPLAFGRGVLLPWGLLPHPVRLNVVVGAPIDVEKYQGEPSGPQFEALVDKYHARYVTELKQLFNDHKEKYAKEAANLELVE